MKYALIVEGEVVQVQPNAQDGFVEVPDNVICHQIANADGTFSNPPPSTPSVEETIVAAEQNQTLRLIRGALLGDAYALSKLQELDADISSLRTEVR